MEVPYVIYPGMNETHALLSRQYFRCKPDAATYVRHDLRIWESATGREPRLRDRDGKLLFGDSLMADWKARATSKGTARLRSYYDTHPDRNSRLTLDAAAKNRFGDPLPKIEHKLDAAAEARVGATRQHIIQVFEKIAKANQGKLFAIQEDGGYQDHPGGGTRMGTNPTESVCDSFGRTHDHENLFCVGAPTLPTGGCTNGTLTFVALTLRSADRMAEET
jgi:choline dehydrogenase-like flavoprotein